MTRLIVTSLMVILCSCSTNKHLTIANGQLNTSEDPSLSEINKFVSKEMVNIRLKNGQKLVALKVTITHDHITAQTQQGKDSLIYLSNITRLFWTSHLKGARTGALYGFAGGALIGLPAAFSGGEGGIGPPKELVPVFLGVIFGVASGLVGLVTGYYHSIEFNESNELR